MKYRIYRQHTHEGVTYPAHTEADLPESVVQWLMQTEGRVRAQVIEEAAQVMQEHGLEPIVAPVAESEPEPDDE